MGRKSKRSVVSVLLFVAGTACSLETGSFPSPGVEVNPEIYVFSLNGQATNFTNSGDADEDPVWAPDGSKIAFVRSTGEQREIFTMNSRGGGVKNLTRNDADDDQDPAWSPDSKKIAFVRGAENSYGQIYVMGDDGNAQVNLSASDTDDRHPVWSLDGQRIAFVRDRRIYVMNTDGSAQAALKQSPVVQSNPIWSPDGAWIAFVADLGSHDSLQVASVDGTGLVGKVKVPEIHSPVWSPDGTRIAFGCVLREQPDSPNPFVLPPISLCVVRPDGTSLDPQEPFPPSLLGPYLAWSPDGTAIAFVDADTLYVVISDAGGRRTVKLGADVDGTPTWSPDSTKIAIEFEAH